ncbi:hypothetical protein SO3561_03659 [Streptomyces olivochromogenes]|uniref:Uncharacterized protein n=1 Tax=Streptomyces olivochromogenes TaxID=1963 RepID=A0A250VDS1_STROL|nr:hypothetical protein SO3561_03659 [Streptomyces olivochromogenes]
MPLWAMRCRIPRPRNHTSVGEPSVRLASDRPPQPTAVISNSVATAPPCALIRDRIWALQNFSQLVPPVSLRVRVGARAA